MTPERKLAARKEVERLFREEQVRAGRAEPPERPEVERWPALPGQAVGDAKDELVRIREAGFDPVRWKDDPKYRDLPGMAKLAEQWVSETARRGKKPPATPGPSQAEYERDGEKLNAEAHNAGIDREIGELAGRKRVVQGTEQ
jgi:hypothetical protein